VVPPVSLLWDLLKRLANRNQNKPTGGFVMDRRILCAGVAVLASSFLLLTGVASAHGNGSPSLVAKGTCEVTSLPSFMAQGEFSEEATVGDVIEVSCDPFTYSAGATVTVTASQLYSRCHEITWYQPNVEGYPYTSTGRSVTLKLDVDGNANVGLIAGPHCMVGESLITVDENESPYETYTTDFNVVPTENTTQSLKLLPESQVEDDQSSAVVTIAQAEFSKASEDRVRIGAGQLYDRCKDGEKIVYVKENRETSADSPEDLDAIKLDDNGNGFVLLEGTDSCAEGPSVFEADLEESPYTTIPGPGEPNPTFTVEAPKER
jgi:hypothetical protein